PTCAALPSTAGTISPRRRRKRRRRRCSNSLPSPFQRFENGLVKKRSERQSSGLVDRGLNDFCRNFRTVLAAIAEPFLPQSLNHSCRSQKASLRPRRGTYVAGGKQAMDDVAWSGGRIGARGGARDSFWHWNRDNASGVRP